MSDDKHMSTHDDIYAHDVELQSERSNKSPFHTTNHLIPYTQRKECKVAFNWLFMEVFAAVG